MKHRQALLCMALLLGACGQKPPPDAPVAKPPLPLAELEPLLQQLLRVDRAVKG